VYRVFGAVSLDTWCVFCVYEYSTLLE